MDYSYSALRKGDFDTALEWANLAVERDSQFTAGYYLRGEVHEARGELREAIQDYSYIVESDSGGDFSSARIERGRIYEKLGQLDAAAEDYSRAILATPDSRFGPQMYAELRARRDGPDTVDEMIEVFDRAVKENPDNESLRTARSILANCRRGT